MEENPPPLTRAAGPMSWGAARYAAGMLLAWLLVPPLVIATLLLFVWTWGNFLAFGSVKVINRTTVPITSAKLETFYAERPIGPIKPGAAKRIFFRIGGERAWAVELKGANGDYFQADSGYYAMLLDPVVNDTITVTSRGVLLNGKPY